MIFKTRKAEPTFQSRAEWVKYIDTFKVSEDFRNKMKALIHEHGVSPESIIHKNSKSNNEAHQLGLSLVSLVPESDENSDPKDAERLILEIFDFVADSYKIAFENNKDTLIKTLKTIKEDKRKSGA